MGHVSRGWSTTSDGFASVGGAMDVQIVDYRLEERWLRSCTCRFITVRS